MTGVKARAQGRIYRAQKSVGHEGHYGLRRQAKRDDAFLDIRKHTGNRTYM